MQFTHLDAGDLPHGKYLSLVGTYSHSGADPVHPDPWEKNHSYLWLLNPETDSVYECAVHTQLSRATDVLMCLFREPLGVPAWPDFGLSTDRQALSYLELGLRSKNFRAVGRPTLTNQMLGCAVRADRIQIYGFAHTSGKWIHDIHLNSGEPSHMTRTNRNRKDGALVFYYADRPGVPAHRLWLCLKFAAQEL